MEFPIEDIEEIKWSDAAFEGLAVAKEKKAIIFAMAEARTQQWSGSSFDDFIVERRQGVDVLLQ